MSKSRVAVVAAAASVAVAVVVLHPMFISFVNKALVETALSRFYVLPFTLSLWYAPSLMSFGVLVDSDKICRVIRRILRFCESKKEKEIENKSIKT